MTDESIKSPCINTCELDAADVCRGCYRSLDEIARWGSASDEERRSIVASANLRKLVRTGD